MAKRMFESESADTEQTMVPGAIVYVLDDDFRDEWFHKWPGVVSRVMDRERKVFVEFMGFGQREHRTKVFHPRQVQILHDDETHARVNVVFKQTKILPDDGRKHWRRRMAEEPPRDDMAGFDAPEPQPESGDDAG